MRNKLSEKIIESVWSSKDIEIKDVVLQKFIHKHKVIKFTSFVIFVFFLFLLQNTLFLVFGLILLVWVIFLIIRFSYSIVSHYPNFEWVIQGIFELVLFFWQTKNKIIDNSNKLLQSLQKFWFILFFPTTIVFIYTNINQLINWSLNFQSIWFIWANVWLWDIFGEHLFIAIYSFILGIFIVPKILVLILPYWLRNATPIFFSLLFSLGTIVFLGWKELLNNMQWLAIIFGWLTVFAEIVWWWQISSAKTLSKKNLNEYFSEKYTSESLNWNNTKSNKELLWIYLDWKNKIQELSKIRGHIPYITDNPIITTQWDLLGHGDIAAEIFKYTANLDIDNATGAIVVWLDGPRWSWKTSVTNILQNDYLAYVRQKIPSFEFRAWSYPKWTMIESFLKDFGNFCAINNIFLNQDLSPYIDSLSKVHWLFELLRFFIYPRKTDAERISNISSAIKSSGKRVVIIIDDIDRISDPEDIESLLKLLRSTANFYGVFYILNYSSTELLKKDNTQNIGALWDFETKFLNWKVSMPEMELTLLKQTWPAKLLEEMLFQEIETRGNHLINLIAVENKNYVDSTFTQLLQEMEKLEWKDIGAKREFIDFINNKNWLILEYLRSSVINCIVRFAEYSDYLKWGKAQAIRTSIKDPRTIKFIVNNCLRLMSTDRIFLEDFFNDLKYYMYNEASDNATSNWPLRNPVSVDSMSKTFWEHLEELLRESTFFKILS